MPFLYPYTSVVTASISSASYLNESDKNIFIKKTQKEFWYGISEKDSIEFSVYDLNKNLLSWKSFENIGEYKTTVSTYYDDKNQSIPYEYKQFLFDLPLYKTEKILVDPVLHISQSNLPYGSYIIGYQFTRYIAGSPKNPLIIKDISPSKTEIKLIPSSQPTQEYNAFCLNKVSLDDVSSLYLQLLKECPYDKIYKNSQPSNEKNISLIKNMFFIPSDGKFVEFLKFIYEDFIQYSTSNGKNNPFLRIQGIKTYFNNFLISNTDSIFKFEEIKGEFEKSVNKRLDILFINFKSEQYGFARQYIFEVFTKYYFYEIHSLLETKYNEKFIGPIKNSLSWLTGKYNPILNSSYIDERVSENDPLTLLIKLQTPLSEELSIKSQVWISNISIIPFLFNVKIQDGVSTKTFKISSPDFTTNIEDVSFSNTNTYFSYQDLKNDSSNTQNVDVSKKIKELNVDYSNFSNFIIFSSAELRHNIFKNKMISVSGLDENLSTLELNYSSSGYIYPYYTTEKETIQKQKNEIIDSFDGFESYLYKTGYYQYSTNTKTFYSSSFVEQLNESSVIYDKFNRDSLVNNTPEHIINDSGNDDYLIFLSMTGHYFDNLYLYIKSLPSQKSVEDANEYSKNLLQNMLQSFGWKLDASLETLNIADNYLDLDTGGNNQFSADERTRQAWNRILNTLPLIYKTKGTEECINLILSCYGIPSTLVNIREYGGTDYTNTDKTSYTIEEKIFMLTFKGYGEYLSLPFSSTTKTIEMKVSLDSNKDWIVNQKIPLVVKYNKYNQPDWVLGVYKEKEKHIGRTYFELGYPSYTIGVIGDYGMIQTGNTQSIQVAQSITDKNPDFILTTGDNIYQTNANAFDDSVGRLYHQFMYPYNGASGSGAEINRFFPVIGENDNDITGDVTCSYYTSFFTNLSSVSTNTGSLKPHYRYYTFKKGNVQFFCLNSDTNEPDGITPTSLQGNWLKQEISSSVSDKNVLWRIAVFHHPWISSGVLGHLGTWMEWPWSSWGIDLCLTGHDHFYERLESNNVTLIVQGAGGAPLYTFPNNPAQSKFRWNSYHGYSLIESRGNKLVFSLYDMYGNFIPDTGTCTLPSHSIINGSLEIEKNTVPFSDKPFRQSDKYILSDPLPIFDGEIFNVMVRKNEPNGNFEYNVVDDLIPTKYDLWTQKKEDGRTIFSSSKSDILTQTYNYKFSNEGILYFGNYENSSSFKGMLDKILIWDSSILDYTFNDHCNNINSYSFTGSSTSYETLYFRMNFDYPMDLYKTNPSVIINQNEIYSSSVLMNAHNFGIQSFSSSVDNCFNTSHSVYPYQFKDIPYNQTYTITSYGPNKFKNQKVKKTNLELVSRLDPNDRSTYSPNQFVAPDSNQIGLFADPNNYKNKDIFRFLGDYGVMSLIADPLQMFEEKYQSLKNIRDVYNKSGNKRTYYNEMFTLYKFYFDKSIFETVKQLIPARNSILTGILIEPTVLERPKYQYKRINSEASETSISTFTGSLTLQNISALDSIYIGGNIKGNVISADFRMNKDLYSSKIYENVPFYLSPGPHNITDIDYIKFLSLKPILKFVNTGWIKRYPDSDNQNVVESHPDWKVGMENDTENTFISEFSLGQDVVPGFYYTGSGYYFLKNCYYYTKTNEKISNKFNNFEKNLTAPINLSVVRKPTQNYKSTVRSGIILDIENSEELGVHCDESGKIIETKLSGSQNRYLIKNWNKENIWYRVGESVQPKTVESQSIMIYKTEIWKNSGYENLIYTSSLNVRMPLVSLYTPGLSQYSPNITVNETDVVFHFDVGTFKSGPNSKTNNVHYYSISAGGSQFCNYSTIYSNDEQYYETFNGYSRNHLNHKKIIFTKESKPKTSDLKIINRTETVVVDDLGRTQTLYFKTVEQMYDRYIKSRQTEISTVGEDGLEDNTLPVQTINVSNINVVRRDNVLS